MLLYLVFCCVPVDGVDGVVSDVGIVGFVALLQVRWMMILMAVSILFQHKHLFMNQLVTTVVLQWL